MSDDDVTARDATPDTAASGLPASAAPADPGLATSPVRDWKRLVRWLRWIVVAAIYLGVLGYCLGTGLQEHVRRSPAGKAQAAQSANNGCKPGSPPSGTQKAARLAPRGSPIQSIAFGRELGTQTRDFEFAVTDPSGLLTGATCLPVQIHAFLRTGEVESAQLNPQQIGATATVKGQQVLVTVTLQRQDSGFGPSGTYSGTFSLVDPRIERIDIPLTVTLAYSVWRLVLVVLLLVLPVSVGYIWLLRGSFRAGRHGGEQVSFAEFDEYVFSRNGVLAIGAGVGSAVLVFSATYLSSATWGGDFVEAVGLFGAMFAAFVAASSPVAAAGQDKTTPGPQAS